VKQSVREFLEQEEATRAARSKAAKRAKRKRIDQRFNDWLVQKAERIEASGNPAAAEQYRAWWRKFSARSGHVQFKEPGDG
jgi:hypothetical protein